MAWSDDIKFLTDYQNEFQEDPKGTGDPAQMEELYKKYKSNFDSFKSIDAQFHDWYSDAHDGLSVTGLEGGEYEKARQAFLNEKREANSQPATQPKPAQQSNAQTLEKSAQPVQQPNENTEEPTQLNEVEVVAKKENNKNMANNQNSEPNVIEGGGAQDPATNSSGFDLDAILSDSSIRDSYENRYKALSDGDVSRQDAKDLGLRRLQRWRLNRAIDRGNNERIKDFVNSGAKRTYVSNGKFITEGEKGWDDKAFENAKAAGFGGYNSGRRWKETLGNAYNNAVDDWRKNTKITIDPYTGKYMAEGFNRGDAVDVTNSEWFKNGRMKTEAAEMQKQQQDIANKAMYDPDSNTYFATDDLGNKVGELSADWFTGNQQYRQNAQLRTYRKNVDSMDASQLANTFGGEWGSQAALAKTLGISDADLKAFNVTGKKAWSKAKRDEFIQKQGQALEAKLDAMRRNDDGTFNYAGAVKADQITKYLMSQLKDGNNPYKFIDTVKFNENSRYSKAGQNAQAAGAWSEIKKQGGTINFNRARAYKSGGNIIKAGFGTALLGEDSGWGRAIDVGAKFIPGLNTAQTAYDLYKGKATWGDLARDAALDAVSFVPLGWIARAGKTAYYGRQANNAKKIISNYRGAKSATTQLRNLENTAKTAKTEYTTLKDSINAFKNAEKAVVTNKSTIQNSEAILKKLMKDPKKNAQQIRKMQQHLTKLKNETSGLQRTLTNTKNALPQNYTQKLTELEKTMNNANTAYTKGKGALQLQAKAEKDLAQQAGQKYRNARGKVKELNNTKSQAAAQKALNPDNKVWNGTKTLFGATMRGGVYKAIAAAFSGGAGTDSQPAADSPSTVSSGSADSGYSYGSGYGSGASSGYESGSESTYATSTDSPYERSQFSDQVLVNRKTGGKLNMRNLNYYQEGAAISAAPVQSEGSALDTVLSDEQMASMFCQLMSQQIGQEVTPDTLIQLIQKNPQIAEQLESFAQDFMAQVQGTQSAKRGAKLSYIKSLKSGCPEGYEVTYNKKGGRLCKECVKKAQNGTALDWAMNSDPAVLQAYGYTRNSRGGVSTPTKASTRAAAPLRKNLSTISSMANFPAIGEAIAGAVTPVIATVTRPLFKAAPRVSPSYRAAETAVNSAKTSKDYAKAWDAMSDIIKAQKAAATAWSTASNGLGRLFGTSAATAPVAASRHQKGGNLSPKEQQEVKAATERNRKKFGKKYTEAQLRGAEPVGKDAQGRDLYLNGDGEAMPIACKGGKTKKCATGGFLTLKNLQNTYRNLSK